MEHEKFKFEQNNQAHKQKTVGIWTLVISIVVAFGFGYGVGFVSSTYFRNMNTNKELANNIQILQANSTAQKEEQAPKTNPIAPSNQEKIAIKTNNTNSTKSEIKAIINSLSNQTNATKKISVQENKIAKEAPISSQTKPNKAPSTNTKVSSENGHYIVQVASFPDRSKALDLVISLIQKGYNASSEQTTINNVPYTRVVITAKTLSEANKIAAKLKAENITNLPIIYERKQ